MLFPSLSGKNIPRQAVTIEARAIYVMLGISVLKYLTGSMFNLWVGFLNVYLKDSPFCLVKRKALRKEVRKLES